MRTNVSGVLAALLVALEGLGLVALVAWQIAALAAGDTDSIESALALIVLVLIFKPSGLLGKHAVTRV